MCAETVYIGGKKWTMKAVGGRFFFVENLCCCFRDALRASLLLYRLSRGVNFDLSSSSLVVVVVVVIVVVVVVVVVVEVVDKSNLHLFFHSRRWEQV